MKKLLLLFLLLTVTSSVEAQVAKYHRVAIDLGASTTQQVLQAGVTIDHSHIHGHTIETEISDAEIRMLRDNGIPFRILIADMASYYVARNHLVSARASAPAVPGCNDPAAVTPKNFKLGSMGGYFTLKEMEDILDSMASRYPALIKSRNPVSTIKTHEGRDIWYVKISDNPGSDENEPEVLYTALHHAREGASLSQLIFYMWYLLENYATDPGIQVMINSTELFFVPCVNPDGYYFNQVNNPAGGGMWRKNRRDNGDNTYGVDLNRNYGQNWGFDNYGSSPMTSSDVYRGPSAFSEPETQAMKAFCESRQFKNALNAHTFSNVFIYPWGHVANLMPSDSITFKNWGALLTRDSRFDYGTCNQTLGYGTNGGSDDWMYGEQVTKGKIFAMTPESGTYWDGFWPVSTRITDICKITLTQNIHLAMLAGNFATVADKQDKFLGTSGHLKFDLTRLGLSSGSFTVKITPLGPGLASVGPARVFSGMSQHQVITDSIAYSTAASVTRGQSVQYILSVDNGQEVRPHLVTKIFGIPTVLLADNGSATTAFESPAGWGVTSGKFVSPPLSITDSPNGDYVSGDQKVLITKEVSLQDAVYAHAQFYIRFGIEKTFDHVQVGISTDGGTTFTPLCGKYSTPLASFDGTEPLYDGRQDDWVLEEADLTPYIDQKIKLRFWLSADFYNEKDGFYMDDLLVRKIAKNYTGVDRRAPDERIAVSPNPSSGIFSVTKGENKILNVRVYNTMGQQVAFQTVSGAEDLTIDLSAEPPAIYLFSVQTDAGTLVKKVVVQR